MISQNDPLEFVCEIPQTLTAYMPSGEISAECHAADQAGTDGVPEKVMDGELLRRAENVIDIVTIGRRPVLSYSPPSRSV